MTKVVLAHRDRRKALFRGALYLALFAFVWAPAIAAGGVDRFLAADSNPEKWLVAAVLSPFLIWIAVRIVWHAYRWGGVAIFVEGDRVWLANRWTPVSLDGVVDVSVTDSIDLLQGFSIWPSMLVLKRSGKPDRKLATGVTDESAAQVATRLRDLLPSMSATA